MIRRIKFDIVLDIVLFVYFLGLVFPFFTSIFPSSYVRIGCALFFLSYYVLYLVLYRQRVKPWVLLTLVFFFFCCIVPYIIGIPVIANRYLGISLLFLSPVIYDYYKERNRIKALIIILLVLAVFAFITFLTTYSQLLLSPYISRSIKSAGEYSQALGRRNIGGYHFIYFATALSVPLLFMALKMKFSFLKVFLLISYVCCVLLIIKSNYLTALIIVVACSLIVFWFVSNTVLKRIAATVAIVLAVYLIFRVPSINQYIHSALPERITSVITLDSDFFESMYSEFVQDRLPTLTSSLDAFAEHPLLGVCYSGNIIYYGGHLEGIGQHSYIFDTFALFGIIPGSLNLYIVFRPLNGFNKGKRALTIATIFCAVGLYVFDNATDSIAIVFGLIYPIVKDVFQNDEVSFSFGRRQELKETASAI